MVWIRNESRIGNDMVFQRGETKTRNSNISFLEDNFEGSGNRVDARWVLTRAIDRIHAICAYGQSERQGVLQELPRRISLGATMLEALCSPIVDESYREEMRLFWESFDKTREDSVNRGLAFDAELTVGLFKFGVLIRLIDRHSLLYERYMKDFIIPPEKTKKQEELLNYLQKANALDEQLEQELVKQDNLKKEIADRDKAEKEQAEKKKAENENSLSSDAEIPVVYYDGSGSL